MSQPVDRVGRFGPFPEPRTVREVITEIEADPEQAEWCARVILAGGVIWVRCEDMTDGCVVCRKKAWAIAQDRTIGQLLLTALASGAPVLDYVIPVEHRLVIAPHSYEPTPVVYVCPDDTEHRVFPDVGMFCPVDGSELVPE